LPYYGLGVLFNAFVGFDVFSISEATSVHVRGSVAHVVVIVAHVSESPTRGVFCTLPVGFGVLLII
jgi:hypothetical protein